MEMTIEWLSILPALEAHTTQLFDKTTIKPPSSSGPRGKHLTTTMGINAERANKKCYNLTSSFSPSTSSEAMMVCGRCEQTKNRQKFHFIRDRSAGPWTHTSDPTLRAFRWIKMTLRFAVFTSSHLSTSYNCLQSTMINSVSIRALETTRHLTGRNNLLNETLCVCRRFCTWQHQIIFKWF